MTKLSRPILRYHGGKWKLADWIISNFPNHRVYVEPFGGAASVLLKKRRSYAEIYNDLDGEIVNLFRVTRERGHDLKAALELTPFSRADFEQSLLSSDDPLERARRTVIRSFFGVGSGPTRRTTTGTLMRTGFRMDMSGSRAPAQDWRNYPGALTAIIHRLQGVVIENLPATEVMKNHDGPETLHYVDPPYVMSTRDRGGDYCFEMSDDQHAELAAFLHARQGHVVLSGYDSPLYQDLYRGWSRIEKRALADGARERTEVLWLSPGVSHGPLFAEGA